MADTDQRPFRGVVGGGVAGLAMSHAPQRADIDHIVLERRKTIIEPNGACIGLCPQCVRLMEQIGCLDDIEESCSPMDVSYYRLLDGTTTIMNNLFGPIDDRCGYSFMIVERQRLMELLCDHLPSKEYIKTGAGWSASRERRGCSGGVGRRQC
jgi:2-polyprenyl-6-methoxyphenol hydroxylase-like FAD-dependent oxidoreductase